MIPLNLLEHQNAVKALYSKCVGPVCQKHDITRMELDILFEDEHLLVVNKPAPLACIPSSLVPGEPTLAAGLLYHLGEGASLHLVNRLDRGTTGAMAAAKNAYTHNLLRERLHTGDFRRTYLAVCVGAPKPEAGKICLPCPIERKTGAGRADRCLKQGGYD